jgi:hypothetical protein
MILSSSSINISQWNLAKVFSGRIVKMKLLATGIPTTCTAARGNECREHLSQPQVMIKWTRFFSVAWLHIAGHLFLKHTLSPHEQRWLDMACVQCSK